MPAPRSLDVFIVVGEESGDQLGAALMRSLRRKLEGAVRFRGVGGPAMAAEGLISLFPLSDVSLMGFVAVARRIARVLGRIRQTAQEILTNRPDILVIIDSPDFTHRVARRVRARAPNIPIVDYVSPSVWAWRPGRARAMRRYIDHVLALLPFEPAAHARLGGPPCSYVGHPLVEGVAELRPQPEEARRRLADPPVLLVLPGSRRSELSRLLAPFGEAVALARARYGPIDIVLPTLPHLLNEVRAGTQKWSVRPRLAVERDEKLAAFHSARAALVASGTATLELALAAVPMVAGYRVAALEAVILRRMIQVPTVILANLVLDDNVVPEFLQEQCTPAPLAEALIPLLSETPERRRQLDAFARLDSVMEVGSAAPSEKAADIVIATAKAHSGARR